MWLFGLLQVTKTSGQAARAHFHLLFRLPCLFRALEYGGLLGQRLFCSDLSTDALQSLQTMCETNRHVAAQCKVLFRGVDPIDAVASSLGILKQDGVAYNDVFTTFGSSCAEIELSLDQIASTDYVSAYLILSFYSQSVCLQALRTVCSNCGLLV